MQNRFAGTNPNCDVCRPMTHTITLLAPATSHPCQNFLPTNIADITVSTHEM